MPSRNPLSEIPPEISPESLRESSLDGSSQVSADGPSSVEPSHALALLRVLWGALLVGQLLIAGAAVMVMQSSRRQPIDEGMAYQFFALNWGMLVVHVLLGSFLRNQIYKRCWRGDVVTPVGYFTANVLMFGLLEAVVVMGLVVSLLAMGFWPWVLPSVVALVVYAVNFPHGGPMFPAGEKGDMTARDEAGSS